MLEPVCIAAKCVYTFLPSLTTDDSYWYLELGHGGCFHTIKTGKLLQIRSFLFLPFRKLVVKHLAAHIPLLGSHLLGDIGSLPEAGKNCIWLHETKTPTEQ